MNSTHSSSLHEDRCIELGSEQNPHSEITSETSAPAICPHCYRHAAQASHTQSRIHPPVIPNSRTTHIKLQDAINAALENQLDDQNYYEVKVLLLNWEDIRLKTSEYESSILEQTLKLKEVFQNTYHYDVEHYLIPFENPYFPLRNDIARVLSDLGDKPGKSVLLILYYNGHSSIQNGQLMWSAHKDRGPAFSWYELQRVLETALVDVLLLLDCGQSVGPTTKGLYGTMEVLAGNSREHKASGTESDSIFGSPFTHTLTKYLREQASRPDGLLITELQALLSLDKTLENQPPIRGILKRHGRPIKLRPLLLKIEVEAAMSQKYRTIKAKRSPFVSITFGGKVSKACCS